MFLKRRELLAQRWFRSLNFSAASCGRRHVAAPQRKALGSVILVVHKKVCYIPWHFRLSSVASLESYKLAGGRFQRMAPRPCRQGLRQHISLYVYYLSSFREYVRV